MNYEHWHLYCRGQFFSAQISVSSCDRHCPLTPDFFCLLSALLLLLPLRSKQCPAPSPCRMTFMYFLCHLFLHLTNPYAYDFQLHLRPLSGLLCSYLKSHLTFSANLYGCLLCVEGGLCCVELTLQATEIVPQPQPHQQVLIHKHDEGCKEEAMSTWEMHWTLL